jgi:hypothetical protein
MSLEKYRSTAEFREILRILQKSSTLQENFMWQSFATRRNVVPIHHFEIDFVAREVVIFYAVKSYEVSPSHPLYLKLDYRESVFKISEFRQNPDSVSFVFPQEIKTREFRHALRHQLDSNIDRFVILKPMTRTETASEVKVKAYDITQHGIGLVISEQNRFFIKNNRILWVTKLQDIELKQPILAEVVYINNEVDANRPTTKRSKELKVGLKLSGLLPEDVLHTFIS